MIPIYVDHMVRIRASELPVEIQAQYEERLTWRNPIFGRTTRFHKPVKNEAPEFITALYRKEVEGDDGMPEEWVQFPRGFLSEAVRLIHAARLAPDIHYEPPARPLAPVDYGPQPWGLGLMADQVEAMKEIERHMAGIVEAPIGDRRRDVAIHLALKHRIPLFVIVSTIAELYQWRKAVLQPDHGIPEASVGLIGDSRFEPGRAVTIALHLTLWRRWTEVSTTTGVICVDRADSAGLTTIFKTRFWHSKYLVGLATGVRQDGLTGLLKAYLGRYVARLDAPLRGRPDLRVRFTDLAWDSDDWLDLMDRIASDETRNRLIATDILQEAANRGKVLVLAERVNHLEQISRLIGQMGGGDMDVITSLVKEPERNQWFAEFADGRRKVLGVCLKSLPLINELACIRALIMASPIGAMDHLVMVAGKVASIGVIHEYKDRPKVLKFSLRRRLKVYRGMGII